MSERTRASDATLVDDGLVGREQTYTTVVSGSDVGRHALTTGDRQGIHMNDLASEGTRFDERVVHESLIVGYIGTALGKLHDERTVIWTGLDVQFVAPVHLGDQLDIGLRVSEQVGEDEYKVYARASVDSEDVATGTATVVLEDDGIEGGVHDA